MDEGTPLNSILNDEPISEPVEAPVAEAAPEPVETPETPSEGPLRGPDGKFIPKQTTGVEPQETAETVPPTDKLPPEEYKAIREEREKRQRLEADLAALKEQFQQLQQPKEPPAPPPSLWEDEEGWQAHQQRTILSQANELSRINASEMAARSQFADFQDKFDLFNTLAAQNPAIVQQAMSDPHPWRKAYEIAQNHQTMQELGAVNMADLEAKIEARLREEMQAQTVPVPQLAIPPSLTGERNVGTRTGPAWTGPKPLTELLNR